MKESASVSQTDHPAAPQMLCVSIHDVAPATWTDCLRLVEAVRAVADVPLTWLVVPHYHFRPEQSLAMEACLNVALERGDELALHGYSHLDTETGILAEPNDVASLAGAIEAIFQRDLARMGEAARRKAVERYDWNEILPQVIARYEALLGGHSYVLYDAVDERERIRVMD